MNNLSKTKNSVLMTQARESLKGKWRMSMIAFLMIIGVEIIFALIGVVLEGFGVDIWISELIQLAKYIIYGPIIIGSTIFFLNLSRNNVVSISQFFDGFSETRFAKSIALYFLTLLFFLLWSLLLIIPGMIASLSYSLSYLIMVDNHEITPLNAISRSKLMMKGNKWKLLCLGFRFIGWAFLCVCTLGIGFLWLSPYMWVSGVKFYEDILNNTANSSDDNFNKLNKKSNAPQKAAEESKKITKLKTEDVEIKKSADEVSKTLKKYKQMLDEGLISQKDYNTKKKEILGL